MSGVDELVDFLRAQLDDDERVARAASPGPWKPNAEHDEVLAVDDIAVAEGFALSGNQLRATVDHIVRWDPARALAEVEAKRRILELHTGEHDCPEMVTGTYSADWPASAPWGKAGEDWAHPTGEHFEAERPCPAVRLLAQPFAGREGWQEEWRA